MPDFAPAHTVLVAVHTPAHSALGDLLSYASAQPLLPGTLVRVPLGQREVLGVVWSGTAEAPEGTMLRAVAGVLDGIAPLDAHWRRLVAFAARPGRRPAGAAPAPACDGQGRSDQ